MDGQTACPRRFWTIAHETPREEITVRQILENYLKVPLARTTLKHARVFINVLQRYTNIDAAASAFDQRELHRFREARLKEGNPEDDEERLLSYLLNRKPHAASLRHLLGAGIDRSPIPAKGDCFPAYFPLDEIPVDFRVDLSAESSVFLQKSAGA